MSDGVSGHQGIFVPLLILGVMMFVVFVAGLLGGMLICYLTA